MAAVPTSQTLDSLRGCTYAKLSVIQITISYFQGLLLWVFVRAIS
jgi:hypothetical protein